MATDISRKIMFATSEEKKTSNFPSTRKRFYLFQKRKESIETNRLQSDYILWSVPIETSDLGWT